MPEWYDTDKAFDLVCPIYDQNFASKADIAEDVATFKLVSEMLGSNRLERPVLDVGCGTGLFVKNTGIFTSSYVGIDISRHMIDTCQKRYPLHTFIQAPLEEFMDRRKYAQIFALYGVFGYALNPYRFLDRVNDLLASNGLFFVQTFGVPYDSKLELCEKLGFPTPYRIHTNRGLRRILSQYFTVQSAFGFSYAPYRFKRLSRIIPTKILGNYLLLEALTIGRLMPDKCFFQVAICQKESLT